MSPTAHERRLFTRVACRAAARVTVDGDVVQARTVDVSLNGVLVEVPSEAAFETGRQIVLEIPAQGSGAHPVSANATVVRSGPGYMACRFVDVDRRSLAALHDLIAAVLEPL